MAEPKLRIGLYLSLNKVTVRKEDVTLAAFTIQEAAEILLKASKEVKNEEGHCDH